MTVDKAFHYFPNSSKQISELEKFAALDLGPYLVEEKNAKRRMHSAKSIYNRPNNTSKNTDLSIISKIGLIGSAAAITIMCGMLYLEREFLASMFGLSGITAWFLVLRTWMQREAKTTVASNSGKISLQQVESIKSLSEVPNIGSLVNAIAQIFSKRKSQK